MTKDDLLALLTDPDVRAALREAVIESGHLIDARTNDGQGRVALLTQIEVPPGTSSAAVQRAVAGVVEPITAPVVQGPPWMGRKVARRGRGPAEGVGGRPWDPDSGLPIIGAAEAKEKAT